MVLSFHVPKFIKKTFSINEDGEKSNTSSPAASVYSYMSVPVSDLNESFYRDPMRCGTQPSVVGYYYDPMGGKFSLNHGVDPTNTGA
jgi:hypothetical protein